MIMIIFSFRKGEKARKPVVVAGCVSQGAPKNEYIKGLSLIGVQQIDRVVEDVEETLKGDMLLRILLLHNLIHLENLLCTYYFFFKT